MKTYPTINRSIVLIEGKKPFYDWSNTIFPDIEPTEMKDVEEHNSYLLEDELFFDDPKVALKKYWKSIFENELFSMCTDPEEWPDLSCTLFTEWFNFHFSSVVQDLTEKELYIEQYE